MIIPQKSWGGAPSGGESPFAGRGCPHGRRRLTPTAQAPPRPEWPVCVLWTAIPEGQACSDAPHGHVPFLSDTVREGGTEQEAQS